MNLRYGLNLGGDWRSLLASPCRSEILAALRSSQPQLVRLFAEGDSFEPSKNWKECAAYFALASKLGATPMVSLGWVDSWKDQCAVRRYVDFCAMVVEQSINEWGGQVVKDWYWCLGDEPNSPWTNDGLSLEGYCDTYRTVADRLRGLLNPFLFGDRLRLGGPCIDGFQPFWFDWIWRFVEEVDNSLIAFVAWNLFGDWREPGSWGAPSDERTFQRLLLSRTSEYRTRSEAIASTLNDRGILNLCVELNAHSHFDPAIGGRYNRTPFGAAYYTSALIHLMQGGADGELLWCGWDGGKAYAAVGPTGEVTPTLKIKQVLTQCLQFGDCLEFPDERDIEPNLQVVAVHGDHGRSVVLVHLEDRKASFDISQFAVDELEHRLHIDSGAGDVASEHSGNPIATFDGFGVEVLTNSRVKVARIRSLAATP